MRLSNASLDRAPGHIRRPGYDRTRITPGIVHLGIGAFHRAHQAVVIDDLLASGATEWGIIGASLRSSDTQDALAPQDCLYTVAVRSGAGTEHRIIGSVLQTEVARNNPAHLIARMADPATRIVSLTITEKGYCHTPQTGELKSDHPDILHDLAHPDAPRSAPGLIVAALARRRAAGMVPFTVLSCDNLSANGHTVQRILTQFATLRSPDLGKWIADHIACPSTIGLTATREKSRSRSFLNSSVISEPQPHATSISARGFLAAMSKSVRAAPDGARRPCSHSCSVRTETPSRNATPVRRFLNGPINMVTYKTI